MESVKVKEFLSTNNSSGFACGDAFASSSSFGFGSASGFGRGSASGFGYFSGLSFLSSASSSFGSGYGSASASGSGSADASGCGSYNGSYSGVFRIKSYVRNPVHCIDGMPTIIQSIRGNIAKCLILKPDLTTTPCFVVKVGNSFAHGKTIKEAFLDAQAKHFNELPDDERLQAFVDAHEWGLEYPEKDFYDWHNKLTGSCKMGRDMFAKEHGLEKLDGKHTVEWFIELTKDAYGGEIIRRIPDLYKNK